MSCPSPTICGPRTFWTFQKMACTGTANYCGVLSDCAPKDMLPDPSGGLVKSGWLRSVLYMLLGSDRAYDCFDFTRRRRGNPADAFRTGQKHGNSIHTGYVGTSGQQLAAMASDLQTQIAGFMKSQEISASVKVSASFAGSGQAQLKFVIGQEFISIGLKNTPDGRSFIWGNL